MLYYQKQVNSKWKNLCFDLLYFSITTSIRLFLLLFSGVSFGAIGLNSPLPVAVKIDGLNPHSLIKNKVTFVALFVDNSQLDGNNTVFIGILSV